MKTIFYTLFLFIGICIFGQSSPNIQKLGPEKGFALSIVYSSAQDKSGNLWFGTEEGVYRYNSKDIFVYNHQDGLPPEVNNRTLTIFSDSKGFVWAGTDTGLCLFDVKKNSFVLKQGAPTGKSIYKIDENKGDIYFSSNTELWKTNSSENIAKKVVNDLYSKSFFFNRGNLFYTTKNGAFFKNLQTGNFFRVKNFPHDALSVNFIEKFGNIILFGTTHGKLFATVDFSEFKPLLNIPGKAIRAAELYNGDYYIGIDGGGIVVLDKNFSKKTHFTRSEDNPESLSSNGVYDLFRDRQNILWISTYGGGVNLIDAKRNVFNIIKHKIKEPNSLASNFTRSFADTKDGKIWFGTIKGISIWDRKTDNWQHINNLGSNYDENIAHSLAIEGNNVWAGTYGDGVFGIDKNSLHMKHYGPEEPTERQIPVRQVYKVFADKKGNIWVGGINANLSSIQKDGKIITFPVQNIRDITQLRNGKILTAGKNGVFIVDSASRTYKKIQELASDKEKINFTTINAIIEDNSGNFVLATNGAGIIFFNPNSRKTTFLNTQNSPLPSEIIQGIIQTAHNTFWISSTRGISKIIRNNDDFSVQNFNKNNGLPASEFNFNAFAKLDTGELIFGSTDGVVLFDPERINKNAVHPEIVFEDLYIFNEKVKTGSKELPNYLNETKEVKLKYSRNSLGIRFAAIYHGSASNLLYSWKLDGLEEKWSKPMPVNFVNYTNLDYGTYYFKVKTGFSPNNLGTERSLKIVIKRPWYASYMVYFIYLLLLAAAIYAVTYYLRLVQAKKNREEQINFLNYITHEIKTPLSILISSLKTEAGSDDQNKPAINSTVERLNTLISQMLDFHVSSSDVMAEKQISKIAVSEYFTNLKTDFTPLLEEKNIDLVLHDKSSEPNFFWDKNDLNKIMYNLISNAVKYSFNDNKIILEVKNHGKDLKIKIQDFGAGIPEDQHKNILHKYFRGRNVINTERTGTGLGLMIVKQIIDQNKGEIFFESKIDRGTTFTLSLPDFEDKFIAEEEQDFNISDIEDLASCRILLVEDNKELRENISAQLSKYFKITEAENGKLGYELAQSEVPDLIITDYMMPEMDGLELAEKLKQNPKLSHIAVFMMTALQSTEHKKKSFEADVVKYINKPIEINILISKIVSVLRRQKKLKDKFQNIAEAETSEKFRTQSDAEFVKKVENIIISKVKNEDFSLQDICKELGMSRTALYMKLKNISDTSPQDLIVHTKMNLAKQLLIESKLSIKEIAYETGFSNAKYFSTSFKKRFGVSPTDYLKKLNDNK